MTSDLSYPIGKFTPPASYSPEGRRAFIQIIADTPSDLRRAVDGLSQRQLDEPYRPGGWTIRQTAHHVPDSHMHAYTRFKLALTEDAPTIKPYDEAKWALLEDTKTADIATSLMMLTAIHDRWVRILRAMTPEEFGRPYTHPDLGRNPLDFMLALYAWHGPHHVAHIVRLRERKGWI